ncbi:unnamed protein product [Heligmosomoides polygyrus]|uniref:Doublecortin domain-containing protein n=1 Tax=Heligmosomoides polygyrus TaxID=6339 RepID=A0A3P7YKS6_HELPZ|nr:unnamed protein product [Heligmosomoides polygyrus]
MTKERSSSVRRPIDTSLSNSFSSGASSHSTTAYGVKTIRFLVNRRYIRDLEHLLSVISEKLDLPYGAKRLYTPNGKLIRDFSEIEDKQTKASINSEKKIETWKGANATKPLIPKQSGALQTEVKKKKKVVKKKKKPEEIVIPQAKPSNGEKKQNKKEEEKKEAKKEEEKKKETPEEKREEPKKGAEVVVPEKNGRQETAERSPSPRKEEHEENNNKTESSEDERERSHTPSSSERSGTASGEHSERDEHSDGNEQDEEKSPLPREFLPQFHWKGRPSIW